MWECAGWALIIHHPLILCSAKVITKRPFAGHEWYVYRDSFVFLALMCAKMRRVSIFSRNEKESSPKSLGGGKQLAGKMRVVVGPMQ